MPVPAFHGHLYCLLRTVRAHLPISPSALSVGPGLYCPSARSVMREAVLSLVSQKMICFSSANFSFVNFSNKVIYKVIWRFIAHLQTNQNFSYLYQENNKAARKSSRICLCDALMIFNIKWEKRKTFPISLVNLSS